MWGAIAAGAAAIGSIIAGVISSHAAKKNQQRQNAFTERMWNMTNTYNSPAQSVQRYKAAGINPAIAANSGNLNVPAQTVEGASPSYNNGFEGLSNVGSAFVQGETGEAQANLQQSQTVNTDADTDLKKAEVKEKNLDIAVKEASQAERIAGVKSVSKKLEQDAKLTMEQVQAMTQSNWVNKQIMQDQVDNYKVSLEKQKLERDLLQQHFDQNEQRFVLDCANSIMDIRVKYSQGQLNEANAKAAILNAISNQVQARAAEKNANTNSRLADANIKNIDADTAYKKGVNASAKSHGYYYETGKAKYDMNQKQVDAALRNTLIGSLTDLGMSILSIGAAFGLSKYLKFKTATRKLIGFH